MMVHYPLPHAKREIIIILSKKSYVTTINLSFNRYLIHYVILKGGDCVKV